MRKGGWQRRYRVWPRGEAAARANRGRKARPAPAFGPAKGTGGRFIARADKGQPFAQGLKATDPAGAALSEAACLEAEGLSGEAQAQAAQEQRGEAEMRAMENCNRALAELRAYCEARDKERAGQTPGRFDRVVERAYVLGVELALRRWQAVRGEATQEAERAGGLFLSPPPERGRVRVGVIVRA